MQLDNDIVYNVWKTKKLNIIYDIFHNEKKTDCFLYYIYVGNKKEIPKSFIKKNCKRSFLFWVSSLFSIIMSVILNPLYFIRMNFPPGIKFYECYLPFQYNPQFLLNTYAQDTKEHYDFFRKHGFYLYHCVGWHSWTPLDQYIQKLEDGTETEDFPAIIFEKGEERFYLTTAKQFMKEQERLK